MVQQIIIRRWNNNIILDNKILTWIVSRETMPEIYYRRTNKIYQHQIQMKRK